MMVIQYTSQKQAKPPWSTRKKSSNNSIPKIHYCLNIISTPSITQLHTITFTHAHVYTQSCGRAHTRVGRHTRTLTFPTMSLLWYTLTVKTNGESQELREGILFLFLCSSLHIQILYHLFSQQSHSWLGISSLKRKCSHYT